MALIRKCRFYPSKVKNAIEDVVHEILKDKHVYDHDQAANAWCPQIVEKVRDKLKGPLPNSPGMNIDRYKLIVSAFIGEVKGQGIKIASKCLWDVANDNYATYTYSTETMFCTCMVFGIYYE